MYKEGEPKDMVPALICVDAFSKCVSVVLLPGGRKTTPHIAAALMQALNEMECYETEKGGKLPDTIYSDREGGLVSNEKQALLR